MKKTLSMALVVLMVVACFAVFTVNSSAAFDISYTFTDGVLTVTGTFCGDANGEKADYPWDAQRAEITEVVISDGIEAVGKNAFSGCENLNKVTCGKTVSTLNMDAFAYCGHLESMTFNGPLKSIGQGAVYSTTMDKLTITGQTKAAFMSAASAAPYNTSFYEKDGETPAPEITIVAGDDALPLIINPNAKGGILNNFSKTWFDFTGVSEEFQGKLTDGTYTTKFVIVDETEGKMYTIDNYVYGEQKSGTTDREFYKSGSFIVMRVDVCAYGIVPVGDHKYTLRMEVYEGTALRYAGTSMTGAFCSTDDKKFLVDGAIIPDPVPHSCTVTEGTLPVECTTIQIAPAYGGWENWVNSPNNPDGKGAAPGVTQLIMTIVDANGTAVKLDNKDTNLKWVLTIDGKDYTITPASKVTDNAYRFETCLAAGANCYVPVKDASQEIGLKIYQGEDLAFATEKTATFTTPMEPVSYGDTPVEPSTETPVVADPVLKIKPYGTGMENWDGSPNKGDYEKVTQILFQPTFDDVWDKTLWPEGMPITVTMEGNGTTKTFVSPVTTVYNGGSWGIVRLEPVLNDGDNQFVPVKDVEYKATFAFEVNGKSYTYTVEDPYKIDVDPIVPTPVGPIYPDPVDLGGYVVAAGFGFCFVGDQLCLPYDFDQSAEDAQIVKTYEFWNNKGAYTFTVTFTAADGTVVATYEAAPIDVDWFGNWSEYDIGLYFPVKGFTPEFGKNYGIRIDIVAKDASAAYYVDEDGIPCNIKSIPEDLSGEIESTGHTWTLTKAGVLTIDGEGDMEDFAKPEDAPWAEFASSIRKLVVKGSVTYVAKNLAAHTGIEEAIFEEGVEEIGGDCVAYCNGLKTVYFPKSLTKINQGIVYGSNGIENANYAGTAEEWEAIPKGSYNENATNNLKPGVSVPTDEPVVPPTGENTVLFVILAVVALFGAAIVVTKKVTDR